MSILPSFSSVDDFWPLACHPIEPVNGLLRRGLARMRAAFGDLARQRRERRAACELRAMDERMLRDIGIAREEIEHAVRCGRGAMLSSHAGCTSPFGK